MTDQLKQAAVMALANCPFCGAGETEGPELRIDEKGCHFVFCFGCGATGPQHAFLQTEAIPSWNRRSAIQQEAQVEAADSKDEARALVTRLRNPRVTHHQISDEWEPYKTATKTHPVEPIKLDAADMIERLLYATPPHDKQDAGDGKDAEQLRELIGKLAGYHFRTICCFMQQDFDDDWNKARAIAAIRSAKEAE